VSEFHALCLEGVFQENEKGQLVVQEDDGSITPVSEALAPFEGRQVQLALAHVPPHGLVPSQWGGGSCLCQAQGRCPAGHHQHPDRLLVFGCPGVLRRKDGGWVIQEFSGQVQEIPFQAMPGHYGRLAGATTDAVEKMREALADQGLGQIRAAGVEAGELQEMLERLRQGTGKG